MHKATDKELHETYMENMRLLAHVEEYRYGNKARNMYALELENAALDIEYELLKGENEDHNLLSIAAKVVTRYVL